MSARTQIFPEASGPVISVRDLHVAFRAERSWNSVVRGLSFDIAPRETLALVGESGSGKSVTALSLMRLLPPGLSRVTGSVQMGGRDLLAVPYRQMRHVRGNEVAMIFQEPMSSLNPLFTVGHQIAEAVRAHRRMSFKAAKAEALQLMERVRIPSAASRFSEYPHRFSGGMRQRIMIAMALASRPKLLIADEPTTALDVTIQGQILDLIKTLQDEDGTAVLFITHDMGVVAEVADRTLVMYKGDPVESGPTVDLFSAAKAGYTRALLAAVPALGSMGGVALPLRFPVIDMESGLARIPAMVAPETRPKGAAPVLEVRGLGIKFGLRGGVLGRLQGRVHAVENVSFELQPGETLSLVGESGCGKSTTARLVMRLLEPSTGEVLLDGMEITGRADLRQMRRRMQMIFQDPFASLNPRMKVGESVTEAWCDLGLGTAAASRHRAEELLEQVGLAAEMAARFPHELSGGQRQRVCIARALALDPAVLVLDEAVSALDASVKAQVINLLLDLQARLGLSYLFISHDMAVVERVSHRVAVMYLGEIVEQGDRQAIFDAPRHPYTRRLIGAVPVPDPSRRGTRLNLPAQELTTTVRSLDYVPPLRSYTEVAPGHIVQDH